MEFVIPHEYSSEFFDRLRPSSLEGTEREPLREEDGKSGFYLSSKAEKQRPEGIRSSSHPLPLLTLFLRYAIEVVVVEADEAG